LHNGLQYKQLTDELPCNFAIALLFSSSVTPRVQRLGHINNYTTCKAGNACHSLRDYNPALTSTSKDTKILVLSEKTRGLAVGNFVTTGGFCGLATINGARRAIDHDLIVTLVSHTSKGAATTLQHMKTDTTISEK